MNEASDAGFAEYIAFDEFRLGVGAGRFRVIANPKLARRYVSQRLMLLVFVMPIIGLGVALALTGRTWVGGLLVVAGIALNRVVMWQAARILLYLATHDAAVYEYVTQQGIMEVRRA